MFVLLTFWLASLSCYLPCSYLLGWSLHQYEINALDLSVFEGRLILLFRFLHYNQPNSILNFVTFVWFLRNDTLPACHLEPHLPGYPFSEEGQLKKMDLNYFKFYIVASVYYTFSISSHVFHYLLLTAVSSVHKTISGTHNRH